MIALAEAGGFGLIATAPGNDVDFVSRFFGPNVGINEDPVTGGAHCFLAPYWGKRLGKTRMTARQVSRRTGDLVCELRGDRVALIGHAVDYMVGDLKVTV